MHGVRLYQRSLEVINLVLIPECPVFCLPNWTGRCRAVVQTPKEPQKEMPITPNTKPRSRWCDRFERLRDTDEQTVQAAAQALCRKKDTASKLMRDAVLTNTKKRSYRIHENCVLSGCFHKVALMGWLSSKSSPDSFRSWWGWPRASEREMRANTRLLLRNLM